MELLKSQKADLFEIAKTIGFDVTSLYWNVWKSPHLGKHVSRLCVRGTDFYFSFETHPRGTRHVYFSPGEQQVVEEYPADSWDLVQNAFSRWLSYSWRELHVSDPWKDLENQTVSFSVNLDGATSDRPFSVSEHKQVMQTLSVIQGLLITYAKESNQKHDTIIADIKKLEKAAESQDRKSWFQQAVGYLISTATAMGLDPEKTRALFSALKKGLEGAILFINDAVG
jgi:hypothetical protein